MGASQKTVFLYLYKGLTLWGNGRRGIAICGNDLPQFLGKNARKTLKK
jgi:hypothetical protein